MQELWVDIPGFEGYQISNFGRVRSFRQKGRSKLLSKSFYVLKGVKSNTGCITLVLRKLGPTKANKPYAFKIHRLVYQLFIGVIPDNKEIDHIDRNPLNNCVDNLRLATRQQNLANSKFTNRTGFKGIQEDKRMPEGSKRFTASIKVNQKKIYLGSFISSIEAAKAYNEAANRYFGEYALLNIVD